MLSLFQNCIGYSHRTTRRSDVRWADEHTHQSHAGWGRYMVSVEAFRHYAHAIISEWRNSPAQNIIVSVRRHATIGSTALPQPTERTELAHAINRRLMPTHRLCCNEHSSSLPVNYSSLLTSNTRCVSRATMRFHNTEATWTGQSKMAWWWSTIDIV